MKATEEVEKMCTFEEMISREQRKEGRREGEIIGEKRGIELGEDRANLRAYTNMKENYDDAICSMLGISMQKLLHLKDLLSNGIDLQPKTV